MILTTIFGTAGLCAGGTFGAFAGAFDGKPFRYAVICGALAGGVGAAGGYFADHAAGNFDEPAPFKMAWPAAVSHSIVVP